MDYRRVMERLQGLANPEKVEFKAKKFGINTSNSLGIYHSDLKVLAKEIGNNDTLALQLFDSGIYEARILASKVFSPKSITSELADKWIQAFDTWEICDSFCMGLISKSDCAVEKALEWVNRTNEFEKRAGFVLMASYGFADKKASNALFEQFLPILIEGSNDNRIYVKKAVNWALRNIGKRNIDLHAKAIETSKQILEIDHPAAQWIAKDALRELEKSGLTLLGYPRSIYSRTKLA